VTPWGEIISVRVDAEKSVSAPEKPAVVEVPWASPYLSIVNHVICPSSLLTDFISYYDSMIRGIHKNHNRSYRCIPYVRV